MIFSHFLTLSLHSLLCASSIFPPFITPYASHPHLFLHASISASRVIIEVIFPPPLRFLFSLGFSSVFLNLILILLFFFTIAIFVFMFSSLCSSSSHRLLLSSSPNSCSFDIDCYDFCQFPMSFLPFRTASQSWTLLLYFWETSETYLENHPTSPTW